MKHVEKVLLLISSVSLGIIVLGGLLWLNLTGTTPTHTIEAATLPLAPSSSQITAEEDPTYVPLTGDQYQAELKKKAEEEVKRKAEEEAAAKKAAEEAEAKKQAETKEAQVASAPVASAPAAGTPEPGSAKAYAYQQLQNRGLGEDEYNCLVSLWNRESGWNTFAYNKSSGAYGIPQSLPGDKMASAGSDWATNYETQINWGLGYIIGRYGSPCGAWGHSEAYNWY